MFFGIANAKYLMEDTFDIANVNIDRTKPKIEIVDVSNTNVGFEGYANKNHNISVKVKISDKKLSTVNFDNEHVKFKLDNNYIDNSNVIIVNEINNQNEKEYRIEVNGIEDNGRLKIEFLEGLAYDVGELTNDNIEVELNIVIDNEAPLGVSSEELIAQGRVNGIIEINEAIRSIEGWNIENNGLRIIKEFNNNGTFELVITDLAGNTSTVNVNITKASYLNIEYAVQSSNVGWRYGYTNDSIGGKEGLKRSKKYRIEALAFNVTGNLDADFLQVRTYIYTNWSPDAQARCVDTGLIYNQGYNPGRTTYKSMLSNDLVTLNGKQCFQFGGAGINSYNQTDINGNKPISYEDSFKYKYGICGIKMKLKDYSEFSIVYQILVESTGWMNACSDGEEAMYNKQSPMTAIRMALIPKNEKENKIATWNNDVGTFNY